MPSTTFFRSCAGVFQGGGCRAAAFVGAYEEAVNRGVSFVEVAGTSAGSIIAALIGAGANPTYLREKLGGFNFESLLRPTIPTNTSIVKRGALKFIAPQLASLVVDQGLHSSQGIFEWINGLLVDLLPNATRPITFSSLPIPTHIISTDLVRSEAKIWSQQQTPNELVAQAVQASCAIPLFFQPVDKRYIDGAALSNLPAFAVSGPSDRPLSTRVLTFSLVADEENTVPWNTVHFLRLLTNTIVDGAQKLQLTQNRTVHSIKIPTGAVKPTDFAKLTPSVISDLINNGRHATAQFFDHELEHVLPIRSAATSCSGKDEIYNHVVDGLDVQLKRVVVAENDTDWVYSLFPTLLCWRARGIRVDVLLPEHGDKQGDGTYRRTLLTALGASVKIMAGSSSVPVRAYILDTIDPSARKAIVGVEHGHGTHGVEGIVYSGLLDEAAIGSILQRLDAQLSALASDNNSAPTLHRGQEAQLIERLATVAQYSRDGVQIVLDEIPIRKIISLTRLVREYKYRQIEHLIKLYQSSGFLLFEPAYVSLLGSKTSILTPPVVEESGGNFILIEGSTRATFFRDHGGADLLRCVVVKGVRDALPSTWYPFEHVRVVNRTLSAADRYGGFSYTNFRRIENAVHQLNSLD